MKTLEMQVISGLGSRMRAVIAGIAWCRNNDAELTVCWPWNDPSEDLKVFPIWFSELWDTPIQETQLLNPVAMAKLWPHSPKRMEGNIWRCRTCEPESVIESSYDLSGWPYTDLWKPSEFVNSFIDSVEWPTGKVVGVHIRHALAQKTTPSLSWFINRMKGIREHDSNIRFFLSCDSADILCDVKAVFPDIITQNRTFRYDTEGIARAAADLFLLQRCDWMIGSYNSSFSELAGWMRGGSYLLGWGRAGWMPGGRYEDSNTPPIGIEEALA